MSLACAAAGGVAAARLRLPPLVGYLVAGFIVGPFTPGFVADAHLAPQLAEIGVILLMFGVGMHFSLRDLLAVRWVAIPGAMAQIAVATAITCALTTWWGWSLAEGIVFGLALSVASTVVLLRGLEAQGLVSSEEGRIAIGWLIIEDLLMVLVLVLLPALTQPGDSGGAPLWQTLAITLAKVAGFIALMLVVGTRVFPAILRRIEQRCPKELFTLAVTALALGVAFGSAELFGVSFALGAFFAGLVVSESEVSKRAARDLQPLQDAFGALFFVAVGMLLDPAIFVREPVRVLLVLAIIVVGKSAAAATIMLLLRQPLRRGLIVSAGLAQVGEFSFILANLGVDLGSLREDGRRLILAGALLSITLNPLLFALAMRLDRKGAHPGAEAPPAGP